jgi:hypothetical protein
MSAAPGIDAHHSELSEISENLGPLAQSRGVCLSFTRQGEGAAQVACDREAIKRILHPENPMGKPEKHQLARMRPCGGTTR